MSNCVASNCGLLYPIGILVNLMLSGLMGLVGQGVRAAVGLKSAATLAAGSPTQQSQFNAAYFFLSLMVGLIAGILAGLALMATADNLATFHPDLKTLLGIAAAGYAGTDFIENAFTHLIPGIGTTTNVPPTVTTPPAAPPVPTAPTPPAAPSAPTAPTPPAAPPVPTAPTPPAAPPAPAAGDVPPPNPPPATVPVRLALSGVDPSTVALKVDGRSVDVNANGYAELILETGIAHTVTASGTKADAAVSGQMMISVSPDDVDKAYELTLSSGSQG
jgi:hypothetical protein